MLKTGTTKRDNIQPKVKVITDENRNYKKELIKTQKRIENSIYGVSDQKSERRKTMTKDLLKK